MEKAEEKLTKQLSIDKILKKLKALDLALEDLNMLNKKFEARTKIYKSGVLYIDDTDQEIIEAQPQKCEDPLPLPLINLKISKNIRQTNNRYI